VTQKRRVRGWLAFPLPGFGSFSFSLGRAGVAAVIGGVAIVAGPAGGPLPGHPSHRAPSAAEAAGPPVAQARDRPLRAKTAPASRSTPVRQHRSATTVVSGSETVVGGGSGDLALPQVALPSVGTLAPAVQIPSLPVQPALPPPPALPPLPPPLG
jgi:hypothetical protein